jgi:hypothetical protein
MDDTWVDLFPHKASTFVEEKRANDAGFEGQEHASVSSTSTSALKRTDSKNTISQDRCPNPSVDTSNMELLSEKIFEKLDEISRRERHVLEMREALCHACCIILVCKTNRDLSWSERGKKREMKDSPPGVISPRHWWETFTDVWRFQNKIKRKNLSQLKVLHLVTVQSSWRLQTRRQNASDS